MPTHFPKHAIHPRALGRASIENNLLAAIPGADYRRLLPGMEAVTLVFGDVLYEPGAAIRHVYFPGNAMLSLLTLAGGHLALEVGLIGREGMLGVPLVLGSKVSPVRVLVQGTGTALRMTAASFMREFRVNAPLRRELYGYTYALMNQVSQTAACNRFHVVEQRLARWLLMTQDRVRTDAFHMTQDFLSNMLGVRRVGVTEAAQVLQKRGLIDYARGNITIIDRTGLESAACACYDVVRGMHEPRR